MAKTAEVILLRRVPHLGDESDEVKVAPGYARNYLIPFGFAILSTAANKRRREVLRQRRLNREQHELETARELAEALSKLTVLIKAKTSETGKLFGSVTAADLAEALKNQFEVELDRRKIILESPIRTLGDHTVALHLHPKVHIELQVRVESTTPLAQPTEEEAPAEEEPEAPAAKKTSKRATKTRKK